MPKTVMLALFTWKDLKEKPYRNKLAGILTDVGRWINATAYEGDIYNGPMVPKYKTRNKKFRLPKNYELFANEIGEGKLWNLSFYDRNQQDGNAVLAVMQPEMTIKKPADIIFEITMDLAQKNIEKMLQFWLSIFRAFDLEGWGFIDVTNEPADCFYKISGITYSHFSEDWKREIRLWERNRYRCNEGILDVYWKNLLSPEHARLLGGKEKLKELLGKDYNYEFLKGGGILVSISSDIEEVGSPDYEAKRFGLRKIFQKIIFCE